MSRAGNTAAAVPASTGAVCNACAWTGSGASASGTQPLGHQTALTSDPGCTAAVSMQKDALLSAVLLWVNHEPQMRLPSMARLIGECSVSTTDSLLRRRPLLTYIPLHAACGLTILDAPHSNCQFLTVPAGAVLQSPGNSSLLALKTLDDHPLVRVDPPSAVLIQDALVQHPMASSPVLACGGAGPMDIVQLPARPTATTAAALAAAGGQVDAACRQRIDTPANGGDILGSNGSLASSTYSDVVASAGAGVQTPERKRQRTGCCCPASASNPNNAIVLQQ